MQQHNSKQNTSGITSTSVDFKKGITLQQYIRLKDLQYSNKSLKEKIIKQSDDESVLILERFEIKETDEDFSSQSLSERGKKKQMISSLEKKQIKGQLPRQQKKFNIRPIVVERQPLKYSTKVIEIYSGKNSAFQNMIRNEKKSSNSMLTSDFNQQGKFAKQMKKKGKKSLFTTSYTNSFFPKIENKNSENRSSVQPTMYQSIRNNRRELKFDEEQRISQTKFFINRNLGIESQIASNIKINGIKDKLYVRKKQSVKNIINISKN